MSFRIIYDPAAAAELREAVLWYEQRAEGLGVRLLLEVDAAMAAIASDPSRFPKVGRSSRKVRIPGWPYSVYFVLNEAHSEVKVIAVWHGARNPAELHRRLE